MILVCLCQGLVFENQNDSIGFIVVVFALIIGCVCYSTFSIMMRIRRRTKHVSIPCNAINMLPEHVVREICYAYSQFKLEEEYQLEINCNSLVRFQSELLYGRVSLAELQELLKRESE